MIGHGHLLADPQVAEVNRLAGEAARRMETPEGLQMVADVFWFTIEFGVLREDGELRAYGAGILSSYGEIEEFRGMEIRPLDFAQMATSSTTSRTISRSCSAPTRSTTWSTPSARSSRSATTKRPTSRARARRGR